MSERTLSKKEWALVRQCLRAAVRGQNIEVGESGKKRLSAPKTTTPSERSLRDATRDVAIKIKSGVDPVEAARSLITRSKEE